MKTTEIRPGLYRTNVRLPGEERKYQQVYGKTKRESRNKALDLIDDIKHNKYAKPTSNTVADWAEKWQQNYFVDLKETTKRSYRANLKNHILPALGAKKIQSVRQYDIQTFVTQLTEEKQLSAKSARNIFGTTHRLFGDAVRAGLIGISPCENIKQPKRVSPELHPLTDEEVPIFLEFAKDDPYYYHYRFLLLTGLRAAELLGLGNRFVNYSNNTIYINRQLTGRSPDTFGTPKHGVFRTVPLPQIAVNDLKHLQTEQKKNAPTIRRHRL